METRTLMTVYNDHRALRWERSVRRSVFCTKPKCTAIQWNVLFGIAMGTPIIQRLNYYKNYIKPFLPKKQDE